MARSINRLTDRGVKALSAPGHYADGAGLWLQVSDWKTKSWVFRYRLNGKAREMGLGATHTVSLAEAREAAAEARKLLREKIDPIDTRRAARSARQAAASKAMTFRECAVAYMDAHRAGWKNAKHTQQWANTLDAYVNPKIGAIRVADVTTEHILTCLTEIWDTRTETASRVRGRIEAILDWATTAGQRQGSNPARWKGHLANLLAPPSRIAKVSHHAALPFIDIHSFTVELRKQGGTGARALEFAILTAARTGEVTGARWSEMDLDQGVWTVPASRMKAKREHRVPLSRRAREILVTIGPRTADDYVFPGAKQGKPLSSMALLMTLRRMGRRDLTSHGFRSTFRDWAAEMTAYPHEVCEMALAHTISNKAEAAYRRGDLLEKRARMMEEWANYCDTPQVVADVVQIRSAQRGGGGPRA